MRRMLKWAAWGLGGVAAVAVLAAGGAFAASEVMIRAKAEAPLTRIAAATDAGAVARGRKLALTEGCTDCHGDGLQGKLFHDEPAIVRAWAPNLTLAAAKQSDAQLARAIRHGVGADGRALWIMPSSAFGVLTDSETADLLAYVRSLKPAGAEQPRFQVGVVGRIGVLIGQFTSEPKAILARAPVELADAGPEHAQGRSLARACVECHGPDLKGGAAMKSPDLTMAAAYDLEDFERLLRTGVAAGDRKLGLMSGSAPVRFNAWSSEEIAALHGYLKARAAHEIATAGTSRLPKS